MHLKDFYIIDIDGVLADIGDRDPHDPSLYCNDTTRPSIVCFMQMVKHAGRERGDNYKSLIYLVSGRERKYERQLEIWLRYYGLDQYVDGWYLAPDKKVGDRHKVETVDMLCGATSKIKDCPANMKKRQGVLILEDRDRCVKAYREAGYEVWQTANGNF